MKDLNKLSRYRLEKEERECYGINGDSGNGLFKVFVEGKSFFCVASNGGGWDHVSVSPCNTRRKHCPTWEEMCVIKNMFFDEEETVIQYHPPKSEYVNDYPYCLHLWRPQHIDVPRPPLLFV